MATINDPAVQAKFSSYPDNVRARLLALRAIILQTAAQQPQSETLQETLKWGEPSYLLKGGSTVRIDWKEKTPEICMIYFHCQTSLIETFKQLYRTQLSYQGNRAIEIPIEADIPEAVLKHCLSLALNYHQLKHLPLLGASIPHR